MSAITGIFYRDGREVDYELIKKMNEKLSHRGPDGSAIWCEGPVGLGHQMLWTTPESLHEKLPFHDKKKALIITADARIDNRTELSEKLSIKNKEDVSDSYFILKAYEKWGEKCPEHLLGDFAFAIWDKNEEKLFCARDHMGIKPFYYYLDDEIFVFGTEIKSLFCISKVPHKMNELKLAFYLMLVLTDKSLTFYEKIFSLAAACSLTVSENNENIIQYWQINKDSKIIMNSEEEYLNTFLNIFSEAINCRLRSAFPIGFELSGGLDSSSVVSTAKLILKNNGLNKNINTYSMTFDSVPQTDESYYIKKVVESGDINSNFVPSDKISPLANIESILWYQDQPFYTINMAILCNLYKKIHADGIRVVLGGYGGDEIVSYGTNYFRDLAMTLEWKKLVNEIHKYSENSKNSFFVIFFQLVVIPLIPNFVKKFFRIINFNIKKKNDNFILNKNFTEKMGGKNHLNNIRFNTLTRKIKSARNLHYFIISKFSHQYTLEMQDRIVAPNFIELRHPFFDKRMVEFCYAIPDNMKFRSGWNRYIQRASMEKVLPKEIQWRSSKKYFDPVIERNFLKEKKIINEIFLTENSLLTRYMNFRVINSIYKEYNSKGKLKNLNNSLWLVTILYLWLKNEKINQRNLKNQTDNPQPSEGSGRPG